MAVPDSEREPSDRDNTPLDPEAELILDYLSNNLPPAQVALVEQRARTEPDFRAKLADIVLIRGLVFLALNKPKPDALKDLPKSDPAVRRARNCELMQVQLYRYIHDETDAATTAEVSRHLDACEDCRDTYEAMRLSADVPPDDVSDSDYEPEDAEPTADEMMDALFATMPRNVPNLLLDQQPSSAAHMDAVLAKTDAAADQPTSWYRRIIPRWVPGHTILVAAFVGAVVAVGAMGLLSVMTSAATTPATPATPASAAAAGITNPAAVRAVFDGLAADPAFDPDATLAGLVHEALDPTALPKDRENTYARIAQTAGEARRKAVEPLLWALAAYDPDASARRDAYAAMDLRQADGESLRAALRREIDGRTLATWRLLSAALPKLDDATRRHVRDAIARDDADVSWTAEALHRAYAAFRGDAAIERRAAAILACPDDGARALVVDALSASGNRSVLPIAIELLRSPDTPARMRAAAVIVRDGDADEFKLLFQPSCMSDAALAQLIRAAAAQRGIPVPPDLP